MPRNETYDDRTGTVIRRESIDLDADTYTLEVDGEVVEGPRPLTREEREANTPTAPPATTDGLDARLARLIERLKAATTLEEVRAAADDAETVDPTRTREDIEADEEDDGGGGR